MDFKPTIPKLVFSLALPIPLLYFIIGFSCENAIFCPMKKNEFLMAVFASQFTPLFFIELIALFLVIYVTWSYLQTEKLIKIKKLKIIEKVKKIRKKK